MTFFKIGNNDYSMYVNSLIIKSSANYNGQTNAAGDTIVDYINSKRQIEVGIIPLDDTSLSSLLADVAQFNVQISFLNPHTKQIENNIDCIIPKEEIEYYTIQANRVMAKAFTLTFTEL